MSILNTIMSSILGSGKQPPAAAVSAGMAQPQASAATESAPPPTPTNTQAPPSAQTGQVDVAAVLDQRAEETDEELNWRSSIVDLMKLLKLDSSLAARKALAKELNYTGNTSDTAAMNIWLHKQVMAKLKAGGGKLPADMLH